MKRSGIVLLLPFVAALIAQQSAFTDVNIRFVKTSEREMDEKGASLVLDEASRRLRVKSGDRPLDISYDDVQKVVVEVDTLGRKAGFGASFIGMFAGGLLFGNAIATAIDKPFDNDHFVHLAYRKSDGSSASYGLTVGRESVPRGLKALHVAFGDRLQIPVFDEKSEEMSKQQQEAVKAQFKSSKMTIRYLNTDKQHPLPEVRNDKALVVVATPATIMRRIGPEKAYGIATLRANDVLVGVTGPGTYVFFYLDPGEYFLVSHTFDAVGLRMTLEAGKDYYLTQTLYSKGIRPCSFLTRHSKELVMYEVAGSLWSDWRLEAKK
jgi:hypothetical protein